MFTATSHPTQLEVDNLNRRIKDTNRRINDLELRLKREFKKVHYKRLKNNVDVGIEHCNNWHLHLRKDTDEDSDEGFGA